VTKTTKNDPQTKKRSKLAFSADAVGRVACMVKIRHKNNPNRKTITQRADKRSAKKQAAQVRFCSKP
jgi:hypothetical protein